MLQCNTPLSSELFGAAFLILLMVAYVVGIARGARAERRVWANRMARLSLPGGATFRVLEDGSLDIEKPIPPRSGSDDLRHHGKYGE